MQAQARVGGGRGGEEYLVEPVARERRVEVGGLFGHEVCDEDAVNAREARVAREAFDAVLHERVEVAEEDDGHLRLAARVGDDVERLFDAGAFAQGALGGALNRGAVGDGVAEGDAEFDDGRPGAREFDDEGARGHHVGVARGDEGDEAASAFAPQRLEGFRDAAQATPPPTPASATCCTSLSPRPERLRRMISSRFISRASFRACATACADSSAGMMPSRRERV